MANSYTVSQNSIRLLNVFYFLVGCVLIGSGAYAKGVGVITPIAVVGGIIASGVFLIALAILGIAAAQKQHQVMLFFYLVILIIIFIIQFSVSIACLSIKQNTVSEVAWKYTSCENRSKLQKSEKCKGYQDQETECIVGKNDLGYGPKFPDTPETLPTCFVVLHNAVEKGLRIAGGIGLFFSFTELAGILITYKFRNAKLPRSNPSAFL